MSHAVVVRVLAVHVECRRCMQTARVQQDHPDGFTRHILQPLGSWWVSHREPQIVRLELTADGVPQEWVPSVAPDRPTNERPDP